ncbi:MAG: BON domain-containing protein [Nitrospinae bacterium]|nr:BON domain-containing protein [Nitrospinota bacterium]
MNKKLVIRLTSLTSIIIISLFPIVNGCMFAVVGGAGVETGYIAGQKDQTAGEVVDDQWITTKIKSKFIADPDISAFKINVDTENGVVTLKGKVNSEGEAEKAVLIAKNTKGVKKVVNKIVVNK